ncbi:hypothetical protein KKF84_04800, partial [Myxococcota bacterium]|nr:hypothetical protein [Myxococcota bacterium]
MLRLFFLTLFLLTSCDVPEAPKEYKPAPPKVHVQTVNDELPWQPPMLRPQFKQSDFSGLPAFMKPRPSVYSKRMWKIITRIIDEIIQIRRHLHQTPELAHREVKTARYVMEQLKSMGLLPRGPVGLT